MSGLAALSVGTRVETTRFTGVVHSVFARACNIQTLAQAEADGAGRGLVSLLAAELGNAPNAVRVVLPPGFDFTRALPLGAPVGCRAGVVRLGALHVRVAGVPRWRGSLLAKRIDLCEPRQRRAWQCARRCLDRWQKMAPASPLTVPGRLNRALCRAALEQRCGDATRAAVALVGCGPGLTPAGDDFLVGFMSAAHATRVTPCDGAGQALRAALFAAVRAAVHRTNTISAAFLGLAAVGEVAQFLDALVSAIADGAGADTIERRTHAALAVGATSGADGVAGLLLGLGVFASVSNLGEQAS